MFADDYIIRGSKLLESEQFAEAAPLLFQGAQNAWARGQVPFFQMYSLTAANAYILAGQPNGAWSVASHVADQFLASGRAPDAIAFVKKVVTMLRDRDHHAVADGVSAQAAHAFGVDWHDPSAPRLPSHCPGCGAAVRPQDVAYPTPSAPACAFCGSALG